VKNCGAPAIDSRVTLAGGAGVGATAALRLEGAALRGVGAVPRRACELAAFRAEDGFAAALREAPRVAVAFGAAAFSAAALRAEVLPAAPFAVGFARAILPDAFGVAVFPDALAVAVLPDAFGAVAFPAAFGAAPLRAVLAEAA